MSSDATFVPASLAREIARRGLTPEEFAEVADLNRDTIYRALKGKRLKPGTMGTIVKTLGTHPALDLPDDLVKAS
jgi:predicted transcriptional regulator